jgi:hypothetical protein
MFRNKMFVVLSAVAVFGMALTGCMTMDPNASYVYKQPEDSYGTVVLSNESSSDLWIWIDGQGVMVHPDKKQTPWNSGPMGLNEKEKFEIKVNPGLHKVKYAVANSTADSSVKFDIDEGGKVIIRFPAGKFLGAGVSTDAIVEKVK